MGRKIGTTIEKDIDFYLNIFERNKVVYKNPGIGKILSRDDIEITIDLYNKKLCITVGTGVMVYDISIDKIVFTEYNAGSGSSLFVRNYNRRSYYNVNSMTEEYLFQLSTIDKPLVSIKSIKRLNRLYYKLCKTLKVNE